MQEIQRNDPAHQIAQGQSCKVSTSYPINRSTGPVHSAQSKRTNREKPSLVRKFPCRRQLLGKQGVDFFFFSFFRLHAS